jgi:hypothetical protein
MKRVKQLGKKPLDCSMCLTFWTSLILHLTLLTTPIYLLLSLTPTTITAITITATINYDYAKLVPKRNIETEFNELEQIINSMNMYFIDDRILLKDIWETYYWIMNDKNKYLEKIKEIHYLKRYYEIFSTTYYHKTNCADANLTAFGL